MCLGNFEQKDEQLVKGGTRGTPASKLIDARAGRGVEAEESSWVDPNQSIQQYHQHLPRLQSIRS